ncbi:MAG: DUF4389 domain-containing protein [Pseudomonadota bacterium]|nr:DUF4389 domain-containing protein [Pseudomonadota bacterium]
MNEQPTPDHSQARAFWGTMKKNLTVGHTWQRAFFMLLFAIFLYIALIIIAAVILFQLGALLFSGKLNERLLPFGHSLSLYISEILLYLTYNSDHKPWPFPPSEWPNPNHANREYLVNFPKKPPSEEPHDQ